jgi:acetyl-CoA acyltransferase
MGITAENVAEKYSVTREQQDELAASSHIKAYSAQQKGYFQEEIIPVSAVSPDVSGDATFTFATDEGIRANTATADLARLKPAFRLNGSVTAGNSSQTTDGAAIVLLMEEDHARAMGITPLARFIAFAVAGVNPAYMGIGPVEAIPKALALAGLSLNDIDLIELNEAFASQALACMQVLKLNPDIVNVNGGAIAMGHPLGCTGAALTVKLINELRRRNGHFGLVSMCIGGGQGAAGIFALC